MSRAQPIQTNFTSGEVSPLIKGRVDITKYFNGVEILENFLVKGQGGVVRRSGTRFINPVKDSSKKVRLVEFEFSTIQAYVLEFGDQYIRFYRDGGIIIDGSEVEVATPYLEADLDDLYFAQSADVLYICHPNYRPRTLSRSSHTSWTLSTFVPLDGPYLDEHKGDTQIIADPITDRATMTSTDNDFSIGDVGDYVEFEEDGVKKIAKIITFVSATEVTVEIQENMAPQLPVEVTQEGFSSPTLTISHSAFTNNFLNRYIFVVSDSTWRKITSYDGQMQDEVDCGTALTMVSTTGDLVISDRTITATLTASDSIFNSTDDDDDLSIRLRYGAEQVWAKVTSYTSGTEVDVELSRPFPLEERDGDAKLNEAKTKNWRLGAWSTDNGWPSVVTFHEERLVFASNVERPQTIWMSVVDDFENFAPTEEDSTVVDDGSLTYTIASNRVNAIKWVNSGPTLVVGTVGAEWQVKSSALSEPISPTNISILPQTAHGSTNVIPVRVGNSIIFVQRSGTVVRELNYSFEVDAFVANDITVLSEHLFLDAGQATDLKYQQSPNSTLWMVATDGTLVSMTYLKDQQIYAWGRHPIGGDGIVESVAVIPTADGSEDEVWISVKRTINGSTKRYVERIDPEFYPEDAEDKEDMFFVDSGLTYDGPATTTITDLDHLEGEEVHILADGAVRPTETVSSGQIELDTEASKAQVGLQFISKIKTLPLEGGGEFGTSQGKFKRVEGLTLRLHNSLGFKQGSEEDNLTIRSFRATFDQMDVSPPLFTGDMRVEVEQDYGLQAPYFIHQDQPYPLTVLALMVEFVTYD